MVLTDRESNVLADDEEGNTIVETVDSSGAVMDSCGNIIAAGDVERNVGLNDGEGNVVAIDKKGNTIVEAADGSGCWDPMAKSSSPAILREMWC